MLRCNLLLWHIQWVGEGWVGKYLLDLFSRDNCTQVIKENEVLFNLAVAFKKSAANGRL